MSLIDDPKMREVFERMTGRFRIPAEQLQKDENGEYLDKETASYWVVFGIAWAESREALVIELPPEPATPEDPEEAIDDSHMDAYHSAIGMRHACANLIKVSGVKVSK